MFSKSTSPIFEIFSYYNILLQNVRLFGIILICSPCQSFSMVLDNVSYKLYTLMAKYRAFLCVTDITKWTNEPLRQAKNQNIHQISGQFGIVLAVLQYVTM